VRVIARALSISPSSVAKWAQRYAKPTSPTQDTVLLKHIML
jgi:DNA-binding transcriptional regulator YiaG